jgi:hypothetical protein
MAHWNGGLSVLPPVAGAASHSDASELLRAQRNAPIGEGLEAPSVCRGAIGDQRHTRHNSGISGKFPTFAVRERPGSEPAASRAKERYSRRQCYPTHSRRRGAADDPLACLGAFLVAFALTGPAWATGGCGVGCRSTSQGACVRDGWQEGLPVRNVCPATSQLSPPCGPYHRWSPQSMMCTR